MHKLDLSTGRGMGWSGEGSWLGAGIMLVGSTCHVGRVNLEASCWWGLPVCHPQAQAPTPSRPQGAPRPPGQGTRTWLCKSKAGTKRTSSLQNIY